MLSAILHIAAVAAIFSGGMRLERWLEQRRRARLGGDLLSQEKRLRAAAEGRPAPMPGKAGA